MLGIRSRNGLWPEALAAVFGIIAFHSIYNYFLGFVMMEAVRRDSETILGGPAQGGHRGLHQPLDGRPAGGNAANIVSLPIPTMAYDAMNMMAGAAIPVALFAMGGVLTRYRLRDQIGEALMVSVFSLLIHPALAWVMTDQILGMDRSYSPGCCDHVRHANGHKQLYLCIHVQSRGRHGGEFGC